jgi:hypothetical protein
MLHLKYFIPVAILFVGIIIGAASGRYYGQVEIFKQIFNDKIECSLTVNPVTMDMIGEQK